MHEWFLTHARYDSLVLLASLLPAVSPLLSVRPLTLSPSHLLTLPHSHPPTPSLSHPLSLPPFLRCSAPNNKFTGGVSEGFLDAFAYPSYSQIDCGLVLANNFLTGPLPLSLANMTQAYVFDFSNNQMTGTLPAAYAHIFAITRVILSNNKFSGTIPASFGTSDSLRQLILDGNQFSGTIPSLSGSARLLTLDLSRNSIAGTFPDVSSLKYLSTVRVAGNQLAGPLPSATLSLSSLNTADFSDNFLSGTRPSAPSSFNLAGNCFKQHGCSGTPSQCWYSDSREMSDCQDFCSADAAAPDVCRWVAGWLAGWALLGWSEGGIAAWLHHIFESPCC